MDVENLSDDERIALISAIAGFLRELHSEETQMREPNLPLDPNACADMARRIPKANIVIAELKTLGLIKDINPWLRQLKKAEALPAHRNICVVHGSFHFRNLVLTENKSFSGVKNWDEKHLGEAAIDLQCVYSFFPPQAREKFFSVYGNIDDNTQKKARVMAIYQMGALALQGFKSEHRPMFEEAMRGLQNTLV